MRDIHRYHLGIEKLYSFFYWPLGDGAPRAATHYLYTLGLDKYFNSSMTGRVTSLKFKSTNK